MPSDVDPAPDRPMGDLPGPAEQIRWGLDNITETYGDPPYAGQRHPGAGGDPFQSVDDLPGVTSIPGVSRTVTVGPFEVFYTNVNRPMGLRAHSHLARIWVTYDTIGRHGYPSFRVTNAELHSRIRELTDKPFRDATNEDAADRLFAHLDGWVGHTWGQWGGGYQLRGVRFDVVGVLDALGHDASTTTYEITR